LCSQRALLSSERSPSNVSNHLPGAAAQRNPEPALAIFLAANEAPELIEFEHVTLLRGQKRVVERGKRLRLFFPPSCAGSDSRDQKCGGLPACSCAHTWRRARFARALLGCSVAAWVRARTCARTPGTARAVNRKHCGRFSLAARTRSAGSNTLWRMSSASQNLPLQPLSATPTSTRPRTGLVIHGEKIYLYSY